MTFQKQLGLMDYSGLIDFNIDFHRFFHGFQWIFPETLGNVIIPIDFIIFHYQPEFG